MSNSKIPSAPILNKLPTFNASELAHKLTKNCISFPWRFSSTHVEKRAPNLPGPTTMVNQKICILAICKDVLLVSLVKKRSVELKKMIIQFIRKRIDLDYVTLSMSAVG
ncbi:unnamed protein product [Protopolystoma xenopodis]|uniref:Uncharacterized protein n=1 Tax=Protopolystoma xenopodis TaxID=117903 RepID=A0A3S5CQ60_9PLAT|nr:unnamed protein product [Protopolystoma xenopodis]